MKHTLVSDSEDESPSKRQRIAAPKVRSDPFGILEDFAGLPPQKKRRLNEPPVHTESFLVLTKLEWKDGNETRSAKALLLLDSGATGPVLAQSFIDKHKNPLERKAHRTHMIAANGACIKGGTHHTGMLSVWIGKHASDMKFEALGIPSDDPNRHVGYLPMSWLTEHNPDIDWSMGTIKWRSTYCRKHCLPEKVKIEWMTEEQMLRELKDQIHVFGLAIYHDEDGEDISI